MDDERAEGGSPPKEQALKLPDPVKARERLRRFRQEAQARAKEARRREEQERLHAQEEDGS